MRIERIKIPIRMNNINPSSISKLNQKPSLFSKHSNPKPFFFIYLFRFETDQDAFPFCFDTFEQTTPRLLLPVLRRLSTPNKDKSRSLYITQLEHEETSITHYRFYVNTSIIYISIHTSSYSLFYVSRFM